jgi:hypothetical protein
LTADEHNSDEMENGEDVWEVIVDCGKQNEPVATAVAARVVAGAGESSDEEAEGAAGDDERRTDGRCD